MDYNILRENDIRGNYPKQINKEVAKRLGESWSYYLKENNISKCIIGHDNRLSSEELSKTLINTILSKVKSLSECLEGDGELSEEDYKNLKIKL